MFSMFRIVIYNNSGSCKNQRNYIMSIARKLGLAINPLVVLSVCLVIFSYQNMKQIQKQSPNISEFAIISTELVYSINTAFHLQSRKRFAKSLLHIYQNIFLCYKPAV